MKLETWLVTLKVSFMRAMHETVWVGLSAGSMMTPPIGEDFVGSQDRPFTGGNLSPDLICVLNSEIAR
jgi:hypothetical protein